MERAELIESVPEVRHDSVEEEKSKVTAEVRPAAGDVEEETVDSL